MAATAPSVCPAALLKETFTQVPAFQPASIGGGDLQHLALRLEQAAERRVIDVLHGGARAGRAVGDVARRQADRHEQVCTFRPLRHERPVADVVWLPRVDAD